MSTVRRFYHAEDDIATIVEAVLGKGGDDRQAYAYVGLGYDADHDKDGHDSGFYIEFTLSDR